MSSSIPCHAGLATQSAPLDRDVAMRRLALFVFFFLPGFAMASWITRMPAIRDSIGASIAEMGLVLFGLSLGSMSGLLSAGAIVGRIGTRPLAAIGMWSVVASMATIALGTILGHGFPIALGLALFGIGMGVAEIAINIEGADVEQITARPLLHALHGFFSFGTVCGALAGLAATAFAIPVVWHLLVVGAVCAATIPPLICHIPRGVGLTLKTISKSDGTIPHNQTESRFSRGGLLLLCMIVLAMAFAEGAANDWLPILMVDDFGFSQTAGSLLFLVFAIAMTITRFTGGYALSRFGRPAVIAASALIISCGLSIITTTTSAALAGLAVLLWGIGGSLYFPAALSIAGDSGPNAVKAVKQVALVGYAALLVGPPALGFIGHELGLRGALACVLALVILAIPAAAFNARVSRLR